MKNMWLPARQPPRCAKEQRPATQYAARGRRTDAFAQRFRTLLSDASKLVLDVLPVPLELPCEGGLAYPIQVVDAPLQLVERELGGGSVSLGFLRTVANALVACVHGAPLAKVPCKCLVSSSSRHYWPDRAARTARTPADGAWLTVLLSVAGALIGGLVASTLGTGDIFELNFPGTIVGIIAAAGLIGAADRAGIGKYRRRDALKGLSRKGYVDRPRIPC
jgi:uncharacterized membrane protein YeaQ/YmgE (transglycosylase-associated protein family)